MKSKQLVFIRVGGTMGQVSLQVTAVSEFGDRVPPYVV